MQRCVPVEIFRIDFAPRLINKSRFRNARFAPAVQAKPFWVSADDMLGSKLTMLSIRVCFAAGSSCRLYHQILLCNFVTFPLIRVAELAPHPIF